jgi:hypothetical protein
MKSYKPSLNPYLSIKPVSGNISRKKIYNYIFKQQKWNVSNVFSTLKYARRPLAFTQKPKLKVFQIWHISSLVLKHNSNYSTMHNQNRFN